MTVKVTEADREAVREHARNKWRGETIEEAFARHRQRALEEAAREVQSREIWEMIKLNDADTSWHQSQIAKAIRALKEQSPC